MSELFFCHSFLKLHWSWGTKSGIVFFTQMWNTGVPPWTQAWGGAQFRDAWLPGLYPGVLAPFSLNDLCL